MAGEIVNVSFVAKAIDRAQKLEIGNPFCDAINSFLIRHGLLFWDDSRALFFVKHPFAGAQVAVWMMPVALQFEPGD